ncbi:hypothetical protein [Desulfopila sp. IMCC35008]|nr:hypothetical protein [Desulfopila sp. IMCC35008]
MKFLDPPITKEALYIGFIRKVNNADLAEKYAQTVQTFKAAAEYQ